MRGVTKESVLADLIESRGLVSALHRSIAEKVATALVNDEPLTASKWMDFLPPMRAEVASPTVSISAARQKVMQLILNAVSADKEALRLRVSRGEPLTEREELQLRLWLIDDQPVDEDDGDEELDQPSEREQALLAEIARLRAQCGEALPPAGVAGAADAQNCASSSRAGATRSEPPDQATTAVSTERVIVPSEVVPHCEIGSSRKPDYGDVFERRYKPGKNTIIEGKAEPATSPADAAPPPPAPQNWDETPNGRLGTNGVGTIQTVMAVAAFCEEGAEA